MNKKAIILTTHKHTHTLTTASGETSDTLRKVVQQLAKLDTVTGVNVKQWTPPQLAYVDLLTTIATKTLEVNAIQQAQDIDSKRALLAEYSKKLHD